MEPDDRNTIRFGIDMTCPNAMYRRHAQVEDAGDEKSVLRTPFYKDPAKLVEYVNDHTHNINTDGRDACHINIHVKPPLDNQYAFYRTFRPLVGMFAPFFACGNVDQRGRFAFRNIPQGLSVPPKLSAETLSNYTVANDNERFENWWLSPHMISQKPLTLQVRVNEATLPDAITGVHLMTKIAKTFADNNLIPAWTQDIMNMARSVLLNTDQHDMEANHIQITDNDATAEVLSSMFHRQRNNPFRKEDTITMKQFIKEVAENSLDELKQFEVESATRVISGYTCSFSRNT